MLRAADEPPLALLALLAPFDKPVRVRVLGAIVFNLGDCEERLGAARVTAAQNKAAAEQSRHGARGCVGLVARRALAGCPEARKLPFHILGGHWDALVPVGDRVTRDCQLLRMATENNFPGRAALCANADSLAMRRKGGKSLSLL